MIDLFHFFLTTAKINQLTGSYHFPQHKLQYTSLQNWETHLRYHLPISMVNLCFQRVKFQEPNILLTLRQNPTYETKEKELIEYGKKTCISLALMRG